MQNFKTNTLFEKKPERSIMALYNHMMQFILNETAADLPELCLVPGHTHPVVAIAITERKPVAFKSFCQGLL